MPAFGERGVLAEELQRPAAMQRVELLEEAPAEQAREHAHRQEEAGPAGDPALAVRRQPAAGHDPVHVRVMRQRRAPGVQHQCCADACAQVLRIGGDGQQRLGGDVEQQAVDHGLVLVGDVGDRRRQREDHVVVLHRQQIGLARSSQRRAALPGTSGSAGCGRSCRRCASARSPRSARHARPVPRCGTARWPT